MKNIKTVIVLLAVLIIFESAWAQSLTDVARSKELTWYGVDFSIARFIGFSNNELSDKIPRSWYYSFSDNENMARPTSSQFPMQEFSGGNINMIKHYYGKKKLFKETANSVLRNDSVQCKLRITNIAYFLDIEKIKKVVEEYKIDGNGFGVLLIAESIEKVSKNIFIWVVYINNSTGKIISSKRYVGTDSSLYSLSKGIKSIIKLSGLDLKNYKK